MRTLTSVLAAAAILVVLAGPASAEGPVLARSGAQAAAGASILYDQYDYAVTTEPLDLPSQDYVNGAFSGYDTRGADDFVVPGGERWAVTGVEVNGEYQGSGLAASVTVLFYASAPGNLPGTLVEARAMSSYATGPSAGDLVVTFASPVILSPGIYWVSVQARLNDNPNVQWLWHYRSLRSNSGAVWQNPNNGFGTGCISWTRVSQCLHSVNADFVFRLKGNIAATSILYDQYNNRVSNGLIDVSSQDYEAAYDARDDQAADDFVVPAGQTWTVNSIDVDGTYAGGAAASVNVFFYANGGGNLPGPLVASRPGNGYVDGPTSGDFGITLTSPVNLSPGTYWVSVQARQNYDGSGQWSWHYRASVWNSEAVWQNPGNDFGYGCTSWTRVSTCPNTVARDLVFRLMGDATPLPTISSVMPNVGPLAGGQTVTILGSNFTGASSITFGGVAAPSFTVVSARKISAVTPPHAARLVNVRVVTPLGTSTIVPADQYTYQGPPTISSVTPNAGPTGGGRTVTILGANFTGTNWLTFGTVAAASFTVNSPTKITAVTPAHSAGLTNVRVNAPSGTSAIVTADQYTFQGPPTITSVAPNNGPTAGGQTVIILGTNFTATNQVYFGGVAASSFTVVSATRISAVTPAHTAGLFHVRVNTPVGMSAAVPADQYTFN